MGQKLVLNVFAWEFKVVLHLKGRRLATLVCRCLCQLGYRLAGFGSDQAGSFLASNKGILGISGANDQSTIQPALPGSCPGIKAVRSLVPLLKCFRGGYFCSPGNRGDVYTRNALQGGRAQLPLLQGQCRRALPHYPSSGFPKQGREYQEQHVP